MLNGINDWSKTTFLLSDERLCDKNAESSNHYQLQKFFVELISDDLCKPDIISVPENFYLSKASEKKQKLFSSLIEHYRYPKFSLLGLGSDSHTASLFPYNKNNIQLKNENCFFMKRDNESYYRITLSYSYIMESDEIVFLVIGDNKSEAIYNSLHSKYDPLRYPVQYIIKNYHRKITLFSDSKALSML